MIKQTSVSKESANFSLTKKIQDNYFSLEPLVNRLEEPNPSRRLSALRDLNEINKSNTVNKLRYLTFDTSTEIQQEALNKLKPIEMFYRRKFSYYQNQMVEFPEYSGYKLGFALICLRYAEVWIENDKIKEYFLHQALKYLNQLIRLYDPKIKYFYYRGHILKNLYQLRLAVEDFKKVLKHCSNHTGALLALIEAYLEINQPAEAYPLIKQLRKKRLPNHLQAAIDFWLSS